MGDDESLGRHITFPFKPGDLYDPADRYPFWNLPTTISWFKKRGYTLYKCIGEGLSRPALPFEPYGEASYPFAHYDTDGDETLEVPLPDSGPLWVKDFTGKVVYAQDSFNRHVVIKLVRADTVEYRVLRFLSKQSMKTLEENCVIPVLDLLPTEGFWFAVMPRWGTSVEAPSFPFLGNVVDLVHCFLKGLAFLHKNNIAHGDIAFRNALVNHFADICTINRNVARNRLRLNGDLSYALFDFDFSTVLPPNANKDTFRLPYIRSWGTFNMSGDTNAGEYEYDPFAFDVGAMGVVVLRSHYNPLVPLFPGLAPLFDMMSTWEIHRRFTSIQALEFFESRVAELSQDDLRIDISETLCTYVPDLWQTLPPDVVERWKMYRTPPWQPWSRRLLCWIYNNIWYMPHIIPRTRWFCFQVFSKIPARIYRFCSVEKFS